MTWQIWMIMSKYVYVHTVITEHNYAHETCVFPISFAIEILVNMKVLTFIHQ